MFPQPKSFTLCKIGNWWFGRDFYCGRYDFENKKWDYINWKFIDGKPGGNKWRLLELHTGNCTCSYCGKTQGLFGYTKPSLPGWFKIYFGWKGWRLYWRWTGTPKGWNGEMKPSK